MCTTSSYPSGWFFPVLSTLMVHPPINLPTDINCVMAVFMGGDRVAGVFMSAAEHPDQLINVIHDCVGRRCPLSFRGPTEGADRGV